MWVLYDGHEYVLRGKKASDDKRSPCISTLCARGDIDAAKKRAYLFGAVLG